jgi:PKD repeat protein
MKSSALFCFGDTLHFWYKGQGLFSAQNSLLILYSEDSANWNGLVTIDTMLVTGTTFSYPLTCEAHYLMFIYNQVSGNLAFDDVLVTMTDYSPVAAAATTLNLHCEGDTVCFFDVSTIAGCDSIVSRVWDFGDSTATDSSANPCHAFSQAGNYPVKLLVTASNGNSDSTTLSIDVYPVPVAQFSSNNSNGTIVDFTDLTAGNAASWLWNFGDSTLSIQQNPSHSFPSVGTYLSCLTVMSGFGCMSTICDSVYVIGAGIDDYDNEPLQISVFPNPAKDKLYVITDAAYRNETVEIFSAVGEKVFKSEIRNLKSEIDISAFPAGIYFLKITDDTRMTVTKILITD